MASVCLAIYQGVIQAGSGKGVEYLLATLPGFLDPVEVGENIESCSSRLSVVAECFLVHIFGLFLIKLLFAFSQIVYDLPHSCNPGIVVR